MNNAANHLLEFGPYRVDPDHRVLLRAQDPVPLSPKAFDLLLVLLERHGKVVSKNDLMNLLWPDTFVEESNLGQHVFQLRKALGERPQDHNYIVTVPGRGYRFVEQVRSVGSGEANPAPDNKNEEWCEDGEEREIVVASRSIQKVSIEVADIAKTRFTVAWVRQSVISAIIAIVSLATYLTWRHYQSTRTASPGRVMMAVLPFQNLTGDPDQEYFADGLTEEMITRLGQLHPEQLGVIGRTSVMGYKHSNERLDQIGRELSVQYVLEGSYRRAGDHLRISAQLIQIKDQSHLWAEDYDRQPQDILTVQDEVALAVAREIQLRLTPQQRMRLTAHLVNPEAHENYLKGRFFWNKRTEEGFRKAVDYFQRAIAADPDYAEAYAGMADAYILLGGYGFEPQKDAMPKAKQAALRAVQLDNTLAEPYASLGLIYQQWDWNWAESERSFKRAIELNQNYSVAHHWYGSGYLSGIPGKTDEEISELRKAHELDPLSPGIITDLAAYLCDAGRYDEGMKQFQEVLKIDPDFVQAHYYLSQAYELQRMYPEAIAEVEKIESPDASRYVTGQLGHIYALQGRRREALDIVGKLQELSQQTYVDPRYIANIYIALGEKDLAFDWLEKAYQDRSPGISGLKTAWVYEPIRSDPRFADLVRRVGIP